MSESTEQHLLVSLAVAYEIQSRSLAPEDFHYDRKLGVWLHDLTNVPFARFPGRKPPQTKKADIETGEDQKGE